MMLMGKLKLAAVGLFMMGFTAVGIGALASGSRQDAPAKSDASKAAKRPAKIAKGTNEKAATPAKKDVRGDGDSHVEPITISGRATDP